ncbi:MAG: SDR family NAD(P)-dependent oxidoreductase [Planctomycetota bacterium]|nr:SDR family NAD(P)-dependent oxidoreductase [Planctomycetota bacterium]
MIRCAITGAADGIGRALALRFGRAGFQVHGVDVDAERSERTRGELEALGVSASFTVADLGTEDGLTRAAEGLAGERPLDVLIHNAGINAVGRFAEADLDLQRTLLRINLLAPMVLTAGLLAGERIARGGTIVFLSSLSHFVGYPGAAAYAASKDGLASYARSLRVALAPRDVNVLTVYPGPTRTEHARRHSPPGASEAKRMPPEELADRIYKAVRARRRTLIPGAANRLFAVLGHVAPGVTERALRKAIFEKLP